MDQLLGFESNACQLVLLHQILLPAKNSIVHMNDMPEAKFLKNLERVGTPPTTATMHQIGCIPIQFL